LLACRLLNPSGEEKKKKKEEKRERKKKAKSNWKKPQQGCTRITY